jgi:cytochrome c-type biogenesis protein CcmH/NrfG
MEAEKRSALERERLQKEHKERQAAETERLQQVRLVQAQEERQERLEREQKGRRERLDFFVLILDKSYDYICTVCCPFPRWWRLGRAIAYLHIWQYLIYGTV